MNLRRILIGSGLGTPHLTFGEAGASEWEVSCVRPSHQHSVDPICIHLVDEVWAIRKASFFSFQSTCQLLYFNTVCHYKLNFSPYHNHYLEVYKTFSHKLFKAIQLLKPIVLFKIRGFKNLSGILIYIILEGTSFLFSSLVYSSYLESVWILVKGSFI